MNDREAFVKLVQALTPWSRQLVFVGGWAHRLYRLHAKAGALGYAPVVTLDVDVAFGERERLEGNIKARLEAAGFEEQLTGTHIPPVSQYTFGGDELVGFYAEFLTPLPGRDMTRDGVPLATLATAGITAQRLRYLGLLLVSPWTVTLGADWGLDHATDLHVPNPVGFIVQKLLIRDRRPPNKQAQDLLYIHDTLELFGAHLDDLRSTWRNDVRPAMQPRWVDRLAAEVEGAFGTLNDRIRDAALIPTDRPMDAGRMRAMCRELLRELLL